MLYKALEIDDLIEEKDADRQIVDLMENNGSHLKLIYLKKHEELEAHMSHTDVCINVLEGEIEFTLEDNESCSCQACGCEVNNDDNSDYKKFKIKKNQLFLFEKNVTHSVKALKDSYFLAIKI